MHDLSRQSNEVKKLVKYLNLSPYPQGGFFSENYRSSEMIGKSGLPEYYGEDRNFSTAIYFMLPAGHVSHFHKVLSDEVWHFYKGGPLRLIMIHEDGDLEEVRLGSDIVEGDELQFVVPKHTWFAACPEDEAEFCLLGCTVSPGFDYRDYELGQKEELKKEFPQHAELFDKYSL